MKVFVWFTLVLLAFSMVRSLYGAEELQAAVALEVLSTFDVMWDTVLYRIAEIGYAFKGLGDLAWYNAIIEVLKGIYNVLVLPVRVSWEFCSFLLNAFQLFFFGTGQN